jgi:MraZ protein
VFIETFFHTLDETGRLAIPSKWRKTPALSAGSQVVVTKGLDTNLWMYTEEDWKKYITPRVLKLPMGDENARSFMLFFVASASECPIDKSGRIQLPQNLIDFAKVKKDVVLNGAGFFMQIWAKDSWDKYFVDNEQRLKNFAKEFFSIPVQGEGP